MQTSWCSRVKLTALTSGPRNRASHQTWASFVYLFPCGLGRENHLCRVSGYWQNKNAALWVWQWSTLHGTIKRPGFSLSPENLLLKKTYWQNNNQITHFCNNGVTLFQKLSRQRYVCDSEVLCMAKMKKADVPCKIGGIAIFGWVLCFLS